MKSTIMFNNIPMDTWKPWKPVIVKNKLENCNAAVYEISLVKYGCKAAAIASGSVKPVAGFLPKDRKSTRLNSSHVKISYAVFCLKKTTRSDLDHPSGERLAVTIAACEPFFGLRDKPFGEVAEKLTVADVPCDRTEHGTRLTKPTA